MGSSTFLLFSYSVVLSLATLTLSDDVYFEHSCNEIRGNYTANSNYQGNLNSIVSHFSSLTEFNYGFFNLSAGVSPDNVNVIALCRGDLDQHQCNTCLNYTATELERFCPSNKEATAWSELCLVRYANRDMYGMLENDPRTCVYNLANASNPRKFNQALSRLLNDLKSKAAAGGPLRKYAAGNATAGNLQTVYATVQCTPDLDKRNCTTCLTYAMSELQKCCYGRIGCRVLRPNCVCRFETNYRFYNQIAVPLPPSPTTSSPTSIGGNRNN
ncbi:cysteine-rich repeat secretory protein 38-like [Durio zibethinus]|uniref:Cysteine-rich repeat secretory protein 38-like n=1 Tax=Durio zibethinus TaxID=66656 RepID=A0A6P5WYJ4_DURZI|nr:cysteine-rich repeat secretory protein 38-like [Durio zibethinus]